MDFNQRIFSIQHEEEFEQLALDIYAYQAEHCAVYKKYLESLNKPAPTSLETIPFLPISFFKTEQVHSDEYAPKVVFKSSGTGGDRSNHFVCDPTVYERTFSMIYNDLIGSPKDQVILALLPNYIEQGDSSLVYMVDHLIRQTENELSGFFLDDLHGLIDRYTHAVAQHKQVVIIGVSYALLDLAEMKPDLSNAIICETGGMKGRRKEMTKNELHSTLKDAFNCTSIYSEYGMTELLSQAYSLGDEVFVPGATMKVLIREANDPFNYVQSGITGGINVIDLANFNSCSFIETQDLGKQVAGGFLVMGRFDHSDLRGCNLLVS